jgi:nitroimidazol reductase NimA-like FMN-containing flavoprotein (pyridoxamine 5'-phosphate oxidase superfamily)
MKMKHDEVMAIMNDPLAQELLFAPMPARMAYTGLDGFPRVIPIGFWWNGADLILATHPQSPKVKALRAHPHVALTIDTNDFPPHMLTIRGTASIVVVDGIPPEYLDASRKLVAPEQWAGFEAGVRQTYKQMARIAVTPQWAQVYDFVTRAPSAAQG